MRVPSLAWRLIVRAERYLPSVASAGDATIDSRSLAKRRRRIALAAVLPLTLVMEARALMHRIDWAQAWPAWRPMILQLLLVAAAAVLVAAIATGVFAWRTEVRRHA